MSSETIKESDTLAAPEESGWGEVAFEGKIKWTPSLEEKKELVEFLEKKKSGGYMEYEAYRIFVGDVSELDQELKEIDPNDMIADIPDAVFGWENSFDPEDLSWMKELAEVDVGHTPICFMSGKFTHIRSFNGREIKSDWDLDDIYCRFYICPEFEHLPEILPRLVEKYQEKGLRLVAKFCNNNQRNDRMVIYSDKESAMSQLEVLQELKDENPNLFENLGKNRLWGKIEGVDGIYFGQENPYSKFSYTEDRAKIIGKTYDIWNAMKENGVKLDDEIFETIFGLCTLSRRVDLQSFSEYTKVERLAGLASDASFLLDGIADPGMARLLAEEIDLDGLKKILGEEQLGRILRY